MIYNEYPFLTGEHTEQVHHEMLDARSRQLDWNIRQHRHKNLSQVFVFQTLGVSVRLGDMDFETTDRTALFIPPMVPHGFRLPSDVVGDVLSFTADMSAQGDTGHAARIITEKGSPHFSAVRTTVAQIASTFHAFHSQRHLLLSHLMQILMIHLRTDADILQPSDLGGRSVEMTRHEQQAHAFCTLIEEAFASIRSIDDYADALGVSAPHLTRISKKVLGATPNELITRRRMIEAERLLRFTRHPVADVALRAGYHDAPYFNRVFKRRTGVSPGAFRKSVTT